MKLKNSPNVKIWTLDMGTYEAKEIPARETDKFIFVTGTDSKLTLACVQSRYDKGTQPGLIESMRSKQACLRYWYREGADRAEQLREDLRLQEDRLRSMSNQLKEFDDATISEGVHPPVGRQDVEKDLSYLGGRRVEDRNEPNSAHYDDLGANP